MLKEVHSDSWQIQIFRGEPDALPPEVAAAWDRMACENSQSTIFQDRKFVGLWSRHKSSASRGRLFVCYARSADGVEVLLPMVQIPGSARSLWTRRVLAAGEPNFDFQDPLVSSKERFSERRVVFWEAFRNELVRLGFCRFTIARTHREYLPDYCERDASEQTWKSCLNGFQSLDQFLSARSSNLRGDVNRRIRRINDVGHIEYEVFQPRRVVEAKHELSAMQRSYEELWEGQPAASLFQTPGLDAWYRVLIEQYLPTRTLHFSRLLCGDQVIAWHFGFLHHGVLHWYKPTYGKKFAHLSPGKVLLAKVIEEGILRGWKAVDYGPGMEPYKLQWANESAEMFRWEWSGNTGINRIVNWLRRQRSGHIPTPE
jgi:CelD/BcsL family acetyltransferase involved in cellulose biosynthesis